MNDLVSVIVPIYNVERYLERCVNSILNQSYSNLDIILVNDGSNDSSGKICETFSKLDKRVRVLHKKNGGLSDARNLGLEYCKGSYVCFIDSDDYLNPKYVEILLNICHYQGCDIAICDYKITNSEIENFDETNYGIEEEVILKTPKEVLNDFYGELHVYSVVAWNKLYKSSIIKDIRYPLGINYEDEATTCKFIWNCSKVGCCNQKLYYYFQRENSIMSRKFTEKNLDCCKAMKIRMDFYKKNMLDDLYDMDCLKYLHTCLRLYYNVCHEIRNNHSLKISIKKDYKTIYSQSNRYRWCKKDKIILFLGKYCPYLYEIFRRIKTDFLLNFQMLKENGKYVEKMVQRRISKV